MRQTVTRIDPLRTANIVGLLYAVLGLIFVPFFLLGALVDPQGFGVLGAAFAIFLPLLYGIIGWIFVGFLCWLYNVIADEVGGIVVALSPAGGL